MEVVTISGYHDVPRNDEQSLLKALAHQPLSVAIDASGRDFQFYSGVRKLNMLSHLYYLLNFHFPASRNIRGVLTMGLLLLVFAGGIQRTLWNRSGSWSGSRRIWIIIGGRLYHREEFLGTKVG